MEHVDLVVFLAGYTVGIGCGVLVFLSWRRTRDREILHSLLLFSVLSAKLISGGFAIYLFVTGNARDGWGRASAVIEWATLTTLGFMLVFYGSRRLRSDVKRVVRIASAGAGLALFGAQLVFVQSILVPLGFVPALIFCAFPGADPPSRHARPVAGVFIVLTLIQLAVPFILPFRWGLALLSLYPAFYVFLCGEREYEIALMILRGRQNRQIARELFVSLHTVKQHVYNLFKKLEMKSRYELIARYRPPHM